MNAQEIATCCRLTLTLMGGQERGPGWAQVNLSTLFVRDADFIHDLAMDLARSAGEVGQWWWRIRRDNELSEAENGVYRRLRTEAVAVAGELIDVIRHLQRNHPRRWDNFEKMVRKQTVRQITRKTKKGDRYLVRDDIRWCAAYIEEKLGPERLEKLLTLRAEMA